MFVSIKNVFSYFVQTHAYVLYDKLGNPIHFHEHAIVALNFGSIRCDGPCRE